VAWRLILSTLLALCLVVLGPHVARLEYLDVLLGNRPAQASVEVYQRMLAGDPDEVHDQAGALLKERPLWSYYRCVTPWMRAWSRTQGKCR
jgi:hypothetical protein